MISKETELLVEKIKKDMKNELSQMRYEHCIGVMNKAVELAKIYHVNEDDAALAGLTHDIAKEIPTNDAFEIAKKNLIEFDEIEKMNTSLIHGKVGAFIVKERYNLNEDIQNAIKYHTTTDKDMDMLARIIYVSDKVEEGRQSAIYDISYERELAKKDIEQTLIYILNENMKSLLTKGKLIHPKSLVTRNYLIMKRSNN